MTARVFIGKGSKKLEILSRHLRKPIYGPYNMGHIIWAISVITMYRVKD